MIYFGSSGSGSGTGSGSGNGSRSGSGSGSCSGSGCSSTSTCCSEQPLQQAALPVLDPVGFYNCGVTIIVFWPRDFVIVWVALIMRSTLRDPSSASQRPAEASTPGFRIYSQIRLKTRPRDSGGMQKRDSNRSLEH